MSFNINQIFRNIRVFMAQLPIEQYYKKIQSFQDNIKSKLKQLQQNELLQIHRSKATQTFNQAQCIKQNEHNIKILPNEMVQMLKEDLFKKLSQIKSKKNDNSSNLKQSNLPSNQQLNTLRKQNVKQKQVQENYNEKEDFQKFIVINNELSNQNQMLLEQLREKQQRIQMLELQTHSIKKQKDVEVLSLQQKINELEEQMDQIRQQMMQNSMSSRRSQEQYLKKQQELEQAKTKLLQTQQQIHEQQIQKIKDQYENRIKAYEQKHNEEKKRIQEHLLQIQELTTEKQQLVQKYEKIEQGITQLKEKFVLMEKDIEKKERQLQKWQSQKRVSHQNHEAIINEQKQLISKLQKQIGQLKDINNNVLSKKLQQNQEITSLKEKINLLYSEIDQSKGMFQQQLKQKKQISLQKQSLKQERDKLKDQIKKLQHTNSQCQEKYKSLAIDKINLGQNLAKLQKALSQSDSQKKQFAIKEQESIKNRHKLQQELIQAKNAINNVEEYNQKYKEENNKLAQMIRSLQKQLTQKTQLNQQMKQQNETLKEYIKKKQEQINQLKKQTTQIKEQNKKLKQSAIINVQKITLLSKQIQQKSQTIAEQQAKIQKNQQNLTTAKQLILETNQKYTQLQKKCNTQTEAFAYYQQQSEKEKQMLNNKIKYLESKQIYSVSLENSPIKSSLHQQRRVSQKQLEAEIVKLNQQLQQKIRHQSELQKQIDFLKKQKGLNKNALQLIQQQKALMKIIQEERASLAQELKLVKQANQILMQTERNLKDENKILHLQKKQSEQTIDKLTRNSVSLQNFNKIQQQRERYIQELKKTTQSLQQCQSIKNKLQRQNKELTQNLIKIKDLLNQQQQKLNQCVSTRSSLAQDNSNFKEVVEKNKITIENLTKKIQEIQRNRSQIQALNKILKQQQDKNVAIIKELEDRMNKNESIKDDLTMQVSMLNATVKNLKATKQPFEIPQTSQQLISKLQYSREIVSRLQSQIHTLKDDIHFHEQKIQFIESQKNRLKQDFLKQSELVANLQHQIREQKEKNNNLENRNQFLTQKNKEQQMQIEKIHKQLREQQEKHILMENQFICLKKQLEKQVSKSVSRSVQSHEVQTILDNYAVSLKFLEHESDNTFEKKKAYSQKLTQGKKLQLNDFVEQEKLKDNKQQIRCESNRQIPEKIEFKKAPSLQIIQQTSPPSQPKKFMKKPSFSSQPNNPIDVLEEEQYKAQNPSEPNFMKRGSSSVRQGSQTNYHNQGFIELQSQKMDVIAEKDQHIVSNQLIQSHSKNQENSSIYIGQGTGNATSHAKQYDHEPSSKGKLFLSMSEQNRHLRDENQHLQTQLSKLSAKLLKIQFYSKKWKQLKNEKEKSVNLLSCIKIKQKLQNLSHEKDKILATQEQLNGPLTILINSLENIIKQTGSWANLFQALGSISYPKINAYQPIQQNNYDGKRLTDKITKIHFVNEKSIYSEGNTPRKDMEKDFNPPFEFQMQQEAYCHQNNNALKQLFGQNDKSQISSVKQHSQASGFINSKSDLCNYLIPKKRSPDLFDQYQSVPKKKNQIHQQEYHSIKATRKQLQLWKTKVKKREKMIKDMKEQFHKLIEMLTKHYQQKIQKLQNQFTLSLLRVIDKKEEKKILKTKQQSEKFLSPNSQSSLKKQRLRSEDGPAMIPDTIKLTLQLDNLKKKNGDNETKITELARLLQEKNGMLLQWQKKSNEEKAIRQKLQETLQREKQFTNDLKEANKRINKEFNQFMIKLSTRVTKQQDSQKKELNQIGVQTDKSIDKQTSKQEQTTTNIAELLQLGARLYNIIINMPTRQQCTILYEPTNREQIEQIIDEIDNFVKNYDKIQNETTQKQKLIIQNYNKVLSQLILATNTSQNAFLGIIKKLFNNDFSTDYQPIHEFAKRFAHYPQQQQINPHLVNSTNEQLLTPTKQQKKFYSGIEHSLNSKQTQLELALALSDYKDKNKILEFQNKRLVKQNAALSEEIANYKKLKKKVSKASLRNEKNEDKVVQQNEEFFDFKDQEIYCNTNIKDQKIKQLQQSLEKYKELCSSYENKLKNKRTQQVIHRML